MTAIGACALIIAVFLGRALAREELVALPHDKRHGTLPVPRERLRPGKKSGFDEIVVVGGVDGRLYAFDMYSGTPLWSTGTDSTEDSSGAKASASKGAGGASGSGSSRSPSPPNRGRGNGMRDGDGEGGDEDDDLNYFDDEDPSASASTDLVPASWAQGGGLVTNPTVSGQAVIPGVDGSLILLEQGSETLKLSRLSMSVEDVVRQTPFQTALRPHDTGFQEPELSVVSSRDSKVLGISARNGAVRFKIGTLGGAMRFDRRPRDKCFDEKDDGAAATDDDGMCTSEDAPEDDEEEDIIWLGMADYTVRAFDAHTMQERWNFSTSVFKGSARRGRGRGRGGERGAVRCCEVDVFPRPVPLAYTHSLLSISPLLFPSLLPFLPPSFHPLLSLSLPPSFHPLLSLPPQPSEEDDDCMLQLLSAEDGELHLWDGGLDQMLWKRRIPAPAVAAYRYSLPSREAKDKRRAERGKDSTRVGPRNFGERISIKFVEAGGVGAPAGGGAGCVFLSNRDVVGGGSQLTRTSFLFLILILFLIPFLFPFLILFLILFLVLFLVLFLFLPPPPPPLQ